AGSKPSATRYDAFSGSRTNTGPIGAHPNRKMTRRPAPPYCVRRRYTRLCPVPTLRERLDERLPSVHDAEARHLAAVDVGVRLAVGLAQRGAVGIEDLPVRVVRRRHELRRVVREDGV